MPLTIGTKEVNNLSGPVSIYIHEPICLKEFPYAPILILFGDNHDSIENYCTPVTHEVYGNRFLQLISDAVLGGPEQKEKDGTVDFYIEGGDFHIDLKYAQMSTKPFPMEQLWNLYKKCYTNSRMEDRKEIKEEYKSTCYPIKNIRWQSGDVRNFFKYRIKDFSSISFLESVEYYSNEFLMDSKFESEEMNVELRKRKAFRKSCIFNMSIFIKLDSKAGTEIPTDANDIIKMYIENKESLIYKQLEKIKPYGMVYYNLKAKLMRHIEICILSEFENEKFFTKERIEPIKENIMRIFRYDTFSSEFESALNSLYDQLQYEGTILRYKLFMVKLQSSLLDAYTMARIYKTMIKSMEIHPDNRTGVKEAVHPLVVMCYFGERHIQSINNMLLGYYKFVGTTDKDAIQFTNIKKGEKINRCLNFNDKDYNLDDKIKELKNTRRTYEELLPK